MELFFIVFLKEIVRCTFENITNGLQIFKFDRLGLIFQNALEILITEPQLNIKPIASFSFFLEYLINAQIQNNVLPHTLMCTLYIIYRIDK